MTPQAIPFGYRIETVREQKTETETKPRRDQNETQTKLKKRKPRLSELRSGAARRKKGAWEERGSINRFVAVTNVETGGTSHFRTERFHGPVLAKNLRDCRLSFSTAQCATGSRRGSFSVARVKSVRGCMTGSQNASGFQAILPPLCTEGRS